jgi:uncharacterized protein (TIGR02145 family)
MMNSLPFFQGTDSFIFDTFTPSLDHITMPQTRCSGTIRMILGFICMLGLPWLSWSQVGIGTNSPSGRLEVVGAGSSATTSALKVGNALGTILTVRDDGQVEISSTTRGFVLPRMSVTQRNTIASPTVGSVIFNTTSNTLNIYFSGAWQQLNTSLPSGAITSLTAGSSAGTLVTGLPASGVSNTYTYTGGNGESNGGQIVASSGVTGLTATLTAGALAEGSGSLTYNITGTPASAGTASFAISVGGQSTTLVRTVASGEVASLTVGTANGTLADAVAASGVTSLINYTGGNGGPHSGQTVSSTGVTGLTASLSAGNFATGSGTVTYNITGTPASAGTASFAINIGGKTVTLTRTVTYQTEVTFTYRGASVTYGVVLGANNRLWMDRNLGASRVATNSTDFSGFGDLFQWGRGDDGHQSVTWTSSTAATGTATTTTLSSTDNPGNSNFILSPSADWRSPANDNLWQGIGSTNNVCPSGWRLPTRTEWETERASWSATNASGAFASPLKLPASGRRYNGPTGSIPAGGAIDKGGDTGYYWSSTTFGTAAIFSRFNGSSMGTLYEYRGAGFAVRCIKE